MSWWREGKNLKGRLLGRVHAIVGRASWGKRWESTSDSRKVDVRGA